MILNCEKAIPGQKFQIEDYTIYYTKSRAIVILDTVRSVNNPTVVFTNAWAVLDTEDMRLLINGYNKNSGIGWTICRSNKIESNAFYDIQEKTIKKQKIRSVIDIENIMNILREVRQ